MESQVTGHRSQVKCRASRTRRGVMLLELLIAIAAAAIVFSLGAQLTYVSGKSSKIAADTTVALGLVSETHESVRAVAHEKWQNLFSITKNAVYHTEISSGKWTIVSGGATTTINGIDYGRTFIAQNMCRNQSTDAVTGITDSSGVATTCSTSGGQYDPSTQKITVTVWWVGSDGVTISEYVARWRNKICNQTDWSTGVGSGVKTCPDATYESKDASLTATTGIMIQ